MKAYIREYPIWSFLIINYLISWTFLYPSYQIILEYGEIRPLALIGLIGAYGPSISAIIVQNILDKKNLKELLKKLILLKTSYRTILFVILAPIVLYVGSLLIAHNLFSSNLEFNWILFISNIPFWFLVALPFGPMGEELGWRGFMLPKLLEHNSLIKSTIYVGLAWGIWHLASFTFPGAALPKFFDVTIWTIILFCINTISLSFIYTFVYLHTNGSVFYAILLHAFFNSGSSIAVDLLGDSKNTSIQVTAYILNFLVAGLCGWLLIKKHNSNYTNEKESDI